MKQIKRNGYTVYLGNGKDFNCDMILFRFEVWKDDTYWYYGNQATFDDCRWLANRWLDKQA